MTMAEFVDILHRDHTIRSSDDMHVPRMKGSYSFTAGHAITLSALCNSMEKPSQAGFSQEVNYEDVFGGPPRFAALMSAPHSGSAILDRATARVPSFRSSSLPAFELPVFGDNANAFGSTVYDARANPDVYDDIFNEEGPMPDDAFLAPNLYGVSRSRASSRFSSRRMSPVHPAVASAGQLGGDEFLVLTNSASFSKTRPAAEKLSRRGSLHSASSFDESGVDGPLSGLRNESFTSSLPSSPPQSCHLQSFIGSTGTVDIGTSTTSVEFDDVFGGFPKRMYSQPFSAVPHDSKNVTDASESHSTRIPAGCESPGVKGLAIESRVRRSFSAACALDTSDATLSRSSSINDDREYHEKEIRIDRQADLSASEWSEQIAGEASGAANEASLSFQSSSSLHQSRPSPMPPVTQLKYKSWKDWFSELPYSHTSTLSSINGVDSVATAASMVTPTKEVAMDEDAAESCIEKQFVKNLQQAEHYNEKPSHTIAAGHKVKVKVKPAEYTIEMEEKELQALLTNAWKINEQIERESYNARFPEEVLKVSDLEPHQNDKKSYQSLDTQQRDHMCLDERNDDINWKEWRNYGRGQRKHGGLATKDSSLKTPVSVDGEDMHMNRVLASSEVSPDGSTALDSMKKSSKGMCGVCENDDEYHFKEQRQGRSDDVDRVASYRGSISGLSREFLHSDEQNRISSSVQVEDADCLIDLASSLDGFQEIDGESFERRKSRWERHVRSRDRAAKALEELQHRDAELQREQQEKKQFSETSDGKIKRWAAGKEGNLRALLSNLQHVLWLECGWQPIPLTDLIEVPDVKRAYRKATLFVHPDKVQQKGATIQQKYIAERVFDILQEAWKTFSMQENF